MNYGMNKNESNYITLCILEEINLADGKGYPEQIKEKVREHFLFEINICGMNGFITNDCVILMYTFPVYIEYLYTAVNILNELKK